MTNEKSQSMNSQTKQKEEHIEQAPKVEKKPTPTWYVWTKDIALGVINVIFVIAVIVLMNRLPAKANQLKAIRTQGASSLFDDVAVQRFDIENSQGDIDKLSGMFPDEDGVITFVSEIEKMRGDGGTVVGFTFATKDPVPDRTKNMGLPILIVMRGSWEDLGRDIAKIQSMKYMFRPVSFTAEEKTDEGVVELQYGGFLYVDRSLEKDR